MGVGQGRCGLRRQRDCNEHGDAKSGGARRRSRSRTEAPGAGYLQEAWAEAHHDGIDGDCLAQTALFLALAELISTYGEEAAARYAENLAPRIRNGEFSVELSRQ